MATGFGEPVVSRGQFDPRESPLGLYLGSTLVWHLLVVGGAVALVVVGHALRPF